MKIRLILIFLWQNRLYATVLHNLEPKGKCHNKIRQFLINSKLEAINIILVFNNFYAENNHLHQTEGIIIGVTCVVDYTYFHVAHLEVKYFKNYELCTHLILLSFLETI